MKTFLGEEATPWSVIVAQKRIGEKSEIRDIPQTNLPATETGDNGVAA